MRARPQSSFFYLFAVRQLPAGEGLVETLLWRGKDRNQVFEQPLEGAQSFGAVAGMGRSEATSKAWEG